MQSKVRPWNKKDLGLIRAQEQCYTHDSGGRCVHDNAISSVHCMATADSRPLDAYRAVVVHIFVVCEAVPMGTGR